MSGRIEDSPARRADSLPLSTEEESFDQLVLRGCKCAEECTPALWHWQFIPGNP